MSDKLGDKVRLIHIQEAIAVFFTYIEGVDQEACEKDLMRLDTCLTKLEVIVEVAEFAGRKLFPELLLLANAFDARFGGIRLPQTARD